MDLDLYSRFILALVFILALIGGLAWLARRLGLGGKLVQSPRSGRRLAVVEVLALDARRKLVLLRCDSKEHLVILGPNSDLPLEDGIAAAQDERASAADKAARPQGAARAPEGTT